MHIEIVDVTPDIAREYLGRIAAQRKLKDYVVRMYASDMRNGRWTQDSNALCFNRAGNLMNGQHRLHAVIASGITVRFAVMWDMPDEAMSHMDTGTPRTPGDQLAIQGIPNSTNIASIVRLLIMYEADPGSVWAGGNTRPQATSAHRVEYALRHGEALQSALHEVRPLLKSRFNIRVMACLYHLVSTQSNNYDLWEPFIDGLVGGAGLKETDARLALRAYFARPGLRTWGGGQSHLLTAIRAWNKYVEDEPVRLFKTPRREELPMPKVL